MLPVFYIRLFASKVLDSSTEWNYSITVGKVFINIVWISVNSCLPPLINSMHSCLVTVSFLCSCWFVGLWHSAVPHLLRRVLSCCLPKHQTTENLNVHCGPIEWVWQHCVFKFCDGFSGFQTCVAWHCHGRAAYL